MTHLYEDDEPETPAHRAAREKREYESNKKYWLGKHSYDELKRELQDRQDIRKAHEKLMKKKEQDEIATAKAVLKRYGHKI